jgi:hypothetical protein
MEGGGWGGNRILRSYYGIGNIRDALSWNFTVITFLLNCYCVHSYRPFMKKYTVLLKFTATIFLYLIFFPLSIFPRTTPAHRLKIAALDTESRY